MSEICNLLEQTRVGCMRVLVGRMGEHWEEMKGEESRSDHVYPVTHQDTCVPSLSLHFIFVKPYYKRVDRGLM